MRVVSLFLPMCFLHVSVRAPFSRVLVVKKHEFGRVDQLFACTVFEKVTFKVERTFADALPPFVLA